MFILIFLRFFFHTCLFFKKKNMKNREKLIFTFLLKSEVCIRVRFGTIIADESRRVERERETLISENFVRASFLKKIESFSFQHRTYIDL